MAGALQRGGQPALVLGAGARPAAPLYPAAIGDVTSELRRIFVVDRGCFVDTERTDLAPAEIAPAASAATPTPVSVVTAAARLTLWPCRLKCCPLSGYTSCGRRWRRRLTRLRCRWLSRRRRRSLRSRSGRAVAGCAGLPVFFIWIQATSTSTFVLLVQGPLPGPAGRPLHQAWARLLRDPRTALCWRLLRSCTA